MIKSQFADIHRHKLLFQLLPALDSVGMSLTPDRIIRMNYLLEMIPEGVVGIEYCRLLCPIFATNEKEQRTFISLFEHFDKLPSIEENMIFPDDQEKSTEPKAKPIHRPLIVELEQCHESPISWNILPEDYENVPIQYGENFSKTIVNLRRRETTEVPKLDIPKTISATARQAGASVFCYEHHTRQTEYLLLIESFSQNDHRAAFFDSLYHSLRAQEVQIERFFYQNDLRVCRNERYTSGLNLHELRFRFPNARLLLISNGHSLLSPKTNSFASWAAPVFGWHNRILFTPISREKYGQRERTLSEAFTLLPVSLQSINYVANSIEELSSKQNYTLSDKVREIAELQNFELHEPIMRSLRAHFDPPMLAWIAACSIWPTLHFKFTLQLGKLVSEAFRINLVTATNLLALTRLPWFTAGFIPSETRNDLLDYFENRHPELHLQSLGFLRSLLEKNLPPKGSVAWAENQINLVLLSAAQGEIQDAKMLGELRTVIKRLNRPKMKRDFVLPERWENLLKKVGMSDEKQSNVVSDQQIIDGIRQGGALRDWALGFMIKNWRNQIIENIVAQGGTAEEANEALSSAALFIDKTIRMQEYELKGKLSSYLTRIVYQYWYKEKSKRQKTVEIDDQYLGGFVNSAEEGIIQTELAMLIDAILSMLGERCKTILTGYMNGLSLEEISLSMEIKSGAPIVKKQTYKCRQKLQTLLRENPQLLDQLQKLRNS